MLVEETINGSPSKSGYFPAKPIWRKLSMNEITMPNYYDPWKTYDYTCSACSWHGKGGDLAYGEIGSDCMELVCPVCRELLVLIMYPTVEDSRANWDKLSESERSNIEQVEAFRADFQSRKLREPSPLPDICESSFVLYWDFDDSSREMLIKHQEQIIHREPAIFEGYERFIEVAQILRNRYGEALRDLIPTESSEVYLYGDHLAAPQKVDLAREQIFSRGNADRFA
jgi:hypothetical protein